MLRESIRGIQNGILLRPRRILAASLLVFAASIWMGLRVELRSSQSELAPPDDPDQRRWEALLERYAGSEAVVVCVEVARGAARSLPELRAFADRLARDLASEPSVGHVFHKLDPGWLRRHGLYLLPLATLQQVAEALENEAELLSGLGGVQRLTDLNRLISRRLERGLREAAGRLPSSGETFVDVLAGLLEAQERFLREPQRVTDEILQGRRDSWGPSSAGANKQDGYLTTRDGSLLFLLVTASNTDDSLSVRRALLHVLRERARRVSEENPGFRVAFTGRPAMVVEEMDTVRRDTRVTALLASVGVALLIWFVFRWRSHALLVLVALGLGVSAAYGAVWLELGYLNMITSSFLSTLIGVGVAYGIHPVSEYELEGAHTGDAVAAVRESFRRTGPAVTVAAVTTASAFFSIRLMRFRGFAELGVVAGVGVLLCLASAMITLPALLLVHARWRVRRRSATTARRAAAVDRFWVESWAGRVCRFPWATTSAACMVSVLCAWAAGGLSFDSNLLDLLPRDAESLKYQRRMALESDLSPLFNVVVAEDLEALRAMERRAAEEPAIARFDSVLRLLPRDAAAAGEAIERWRRTMEPVALAPVARPVDRAILAATLEDLEGRLSEAAEAAFVAGLGGAAASLERARAGAQGALEAARSADEALIAAWNREQPRLLEHAREVLQSLQAALAARAPDPQELPENLRQRFFTTEGKPLGFLFPAGEVFDPPFLRRYVAASRRVCAEVAGFPVVFQTMTLRITRGFLHAVGIGALAVIAILLVDYRNLRDTALALLPLGIGILWMLGGMRLLQIPFNFANLVAVPLIIGVGIDNGVHVVHRLRLEGERGMDLVLRHTGRAILIASLTTMIGFGSLALASHRGLASLGVVLLLGVGACLLTSTVVLPNLLVALGWTRR